MTTWRSPSRWTSRPASPMRNGCCRRAAGRRAHPGAGALWPPARLLRRHGVALPWTRERLAGALRDEWVSSSETRPCRGQGRSRSDPRPAGRGRAEQPPHHLRDADPAAGRASWPWAPARGGAGSGVQPLRCRPDGPRDAGHGRHRGRRDDPPSCPPIGARRPRADRRCPLGSDALAGSGFAGHIRQPVTSAELAARSRRSSAVPTAPSASDAGGPVRSRSTSFRPWSTDIGERASSSRRSTSTSGSCQVAGVDERCPALRALRCPARRGALAEVLVADAGAGVLPTCAATSRRSRQSSRAPAPRAVGT